MTDKYLTFNGHRNQPWRSNNERRHVRTSIETARRWGVELQIWIEVDNDYRRIPESDWEDYFGE